MKWSKCCMIDKPRVEKAIREILLAIGENPDREGLLDTPGRIAGMYEEIFSGISASPADVLKYFDEDYTEGMVIVKDIHFYSMCEHHILPFYGVCHIAYIPAPDKLLGLSKLARLVDVSAKKLQLQEKMGREIADVLMNDAFALGAAVVIEAEHLCMTMRGIKKNGAKTVSTSFRGLLKTDQNLRQEALRLLQS